MFTTYNLYSHGIVIGIYQVVFEVIYVFVSRADLPLETQSRFPRFPVLMSRFVELHPPISFSVFVQVCMELCYAFKTVFCISIEGSKRG